MGASISGVGKFDAQARARLDGVTQMLDEAYGKHVEQVGMTDGHFAVGERDMSAAAAAGASLLYGEILPDGVMLALDRHHLRAGDAKSIMDFGMGCGKLLLIAWLLYSNLEVAIGVELSPARYAIAESALRALVGLHPKRFRIIVDKPGRKLRIEDIKKNAKPGQAGAAQGGDRPATAESQPGGEGNKASRDGRALEIRQGDFLVPRMRKGCSRADILIINTHLTATSLAGFRDIVQSTKRGARILTYQDMSVFFRDDVAFAAAAASAATAQGGEAAGEAVRQELARMMAASAVGRMGGAAGRSVVPAGVAPFEQLPANIDDEDRFRCSYAPEDGQHLYLWEKVLRTKTRFEFGNREAEELED